MSALFLALPLLNYLLAVTVGPAGLRRVLGVLLPIGVMAAALPLGTTPFARALLSTLVMLYALKGSVVLLRSRQQMREASPLGMFLYLVVWPGMDVRPLTRRRPPAEHWERGFVPGWIRMVLGGTCIFFLALYPQCSWFGVAAFLLAIHLGWVQVLASLIQGLGFPVVPLFPSPWLANSLNDFWSHRWNLAFVQLNQVLFMRTFRRLFGRGGALAAAFVLSGLLHEFALSYPPLSGWGGPLLYFALQGLFVLAERALRLRPSRLRLALCLFLPLPLVFHAGAREVWIEGPLTLLGSLLGSPLAKAVELAGYGHFLVLVASFQVPTRLRWHEELARLSPLNRKLLWTYGGFIVMNIAVFGLMQLKLGSLMLAGDPTALLLAAYIAVFWTCRILVDFFYFEHSDWPSGAEFVIGHTMLTSLFIYIAGINWILVLRSVAALNL